MARMLSSLEKRVLSLFSRGLSAQEIAKELGNSSGRVNALRRTAETKMGKRGDARAAFQEAVRRGEI